jgi:group I intron endonuclease
MKRHLNTCWYSFCGVYSMKTYIYILKHPETFEVKYVGKTTNVKGRWGQHKSKKCLEKTGSKKLAAWILKLLSNNLLPIMEVIEECENNWAEREKYWISFYGIESLCNLSEGGNGVGHNEYTKTKIKKTLTGRKRTDEEKQAISKGMLGKKRGKYSNTEGHKKRYKDPEERKKCAVKLRKKVGQYDLEKNLIQEFESAREASRQLNIDCGVISKCCRGINYKSTHGFIFKYI